MKKPLSPSVLEREIRHALALPPETCRPLLEGLRNELGFSGFCWLWGPQLYRMDPVLFRPLILAHTSSLRWRGGWSWVAVPWNPDLEQWLQQADERDDVAVCRMLLPWKLGSARSFDYRALSAQALLELRRRFSLHPPGSARLLVELAKFDFWFALDEETALLLYERLPSGCGAFLLRHLPGASKLFWDRLFARVLEPDPELAWRIYRRMIPMARWEQEVVKLCSEVSEGRQLVRELQRRSAEQAHGEALARVLYRLLEARGPELFPYVIPRLQQVWRPLFGRGHYGKLLQLAAQRDWLDLWSALLRICASAKEWNEAVLQSLKAPAGEARLLALAGVAREWDFGGLGLRQVHLLSESTALTMLELRPQLLQLVYPLHLQVSPWQGGYLKLLQALADRPGFEDLLDMLASRFCLAPKGGPEVDFLAGFFASQGAARMASVLGKIPAFAVWNYPALIRENRLARLLFERRLDDYLEEPQALAELVEASQIHVQALAYRCLARARPELAASHLTLLLATLLRPLQSQTRRLAIAALQRASEHSLAVAGRILQQARQARRLADHRYPRQHLLALVGAILHRWPELRSQREQPQVYAHV